MTGHHVVGMPERCLIFVFLSLLSSKMQWVEVTILSMTPMLVSPVSLHVYIPFYPHAHILFSLFSSVQLLFKVYLFILMVFVKNVNCFLFVNYHFCKKLAVNISFFMFFSLSTVAKCTSPLYLLTMVCMYWTFIRIKKS